MNYKIEEKQELFTFLNKLYDRKKVKTLLTNECILINNKIITKYNYLLNINDIVTVNKFKNDKLEIIYEDKNIIVVNKKTNLLTISNEKNEDNLYSKVSGYVKKNNKKNKIFIVHRLDKETSGIVLFAKNEKIKNLYQDSWNELAVERKYIAVVSGLLESGTIKSYLCENKNHYVYSSKTGKLAITHYKQIKYKNNKTLVDIKIDTGRKNQIRVHMKDLNHPIIGDLKYGNIKYNRLLLHAYKFVIINPITHKEMVFETSIPKEFNL